MRSTSTGVVGNGQEANIILKFGFRVDSFRKITNISDVLPRDDWLRF